MPPSEYAVVKTANRSRHPCDRIIAKAIKVRTRGLMEDQLLSSTTGGLPLRLLATKLVIHIPGHDEQKIAEPVQIYQFSG